MPEPSLGELYSYRPNADLAQGDRNIVPDNRAAIQDAIGLAQSYNEGIAQRYAMFQKSFADRLKAGQMDYTGVNPNHLPELKKKAADYFSILYKNPSALAGINRDPKVEADLASLQDDLQRSIAASKQQYNYATAQDAFMNRTPELINDENKAVVKSLYTQPLGSFTPQTLQLPSSIDIPTLSKAALDASKKESAFFEQEVVPRRNEQGQLVPQVVEGKVVLDDQGKPVYEQEYAGRFRSGTVKEADPETYMQRGEALFDSNTPTGKYNQPIQQSLKNIYDKLPESQKIQIENAAAKNKIDPLKYFFKKTWESLYDKQTDLSGVKEVEDTLYKQKQDFRNDLAKAKVKFGYDVYLKNIDLANDKNLELWKDKKGLRDVDKGGEILNDIVATSIGDATSKGWGNARQLGTTAPYAKPVAGGEGVQPAWHKMNVSPNVLKFFEVETPVTKNGKPQMSGSKPMISSNKPVEIWVNNDGTEILPIYGGDESGTGSRAYNKNLSKPLTIDQYKQAVAQGLGLEKALDASNRMLSRMEGFEFPTLNGNIPLYIKNRASGNYDPNKGGGGTTSVSKGSKGGGSKMNSEFPEDNVTFIDNGVTYVIPTDKMGEFLKAKPNAKRQK